MTIDLITTSAIQPAVLGGQPQFAEPLHIVSPRLPALSQISEPLAEILRTGAMTNQGRHVRRFEQELAERLEVPHVVAVSNATLGLILALAALPSKGEVILPSFTYNATAHAVHWAGHTPVFVDILPDDFTLDAQAVEAAITSRTTAIMPVHVFGHPCDVEALAAISQRYQVPLLYDAAHAFGSRYGGTQVGHFGDAEVFSFHATKLFPVGEGGCIATHDANLAEYVGLARKFGDPGTENTLFPGMNAKMQEFNAIIGLEMLKVVDDHIGNRRRYATYLRQRLAEIPGIGFQSVRPIVFHNYQNFAILVDAVEFGLSRDQLTIALAAENIFARKYFYPALHQHSAYAAYRHTVLPITERISAEVLCLPFYSEMTSAMLDGLCTALERIHSHSTQVRHQLG